MDNYSDAVLKLKAIFDAAVDDIIILPGFTCDFNADPNSNAIIMYLEKGEVCRSLKG